MDKQIKNNINSDVMAVQQIMEIPIILDTISMMTDLSFVCVARVKPSSWTACAVLDNGNVDINPGDKLSISDAMYEILSSTKKSIFVNDLDKEKQYSILQLPELYGFKSLILSPIILGNGKFFGNLHGVGSNARSLATNALCASITMLANIISSRLTDQLSNDGAKFLRNLIKIKNRNNRNPVSITLNGSKIESSKPEVILTTMIQEGERDLEIIGGMANGVIDALWGRMEFDGKFNLSLSNNIRAVLEHVITGLSYVHPNRPIVASIDPNIFLKCDIEKLGQLLSNLLNNALMYGHQNCPVRVGAESQGGIFRLTVAHGHPISNTDISPLSQASSIESELGISLFIIFEIAKAHAGKIDTQYSHSETMYIFTMPSSDFIDRRKNSHKVVYFYERRLIT